MAEHRHLAMMTAYNYLRLCVFLWLISPIGDKHRRPHSGHVMVGFVADGNGGTFLLFRRWESVSKRLDS